MGPQGLRALKRPLAQPAAAWRGPAPRGAHAAARAQRTECGALLALYLKSQGHFYEINLVWAEVSMVYRPYVNVVYKYRLYIVSSFNFVKSGENLNFKKTPLI